MNETYVVSKDKCNFGRDCSHRKMYKINSKPPICSYGVIAYTYLNNVRRYLMICRKHTLGYGVIVRGKYDDTSKDIQLNEAVDRMTKYEKHLVLTETFETNWEYLWNRPFIHGPPYSTEQQTAYDRYYINIDLIKDKIRHSLTTWDEPEWEFPKGRINAGETILSCATREFTEETHIPCTDMSVLNNISPFEEYYTSFDNNQYKNTYFLAALNNTVYDMDMFQENEVSKMGLMTELECIRNIRPYHLEKKMIIRNIETILNTYMVV
jgi:hypothetical protein